VTIPLLVVLTLGLSGCFDNMYPTSNFNAYCDDFAAGEGHSCRTDPPTLTYFYQSTMEQADKDNTRDALDYYEATVLDPTYQNPPVYEGDKETDIIYHEGEVEGAYDGISWCNNAVTWEVCDQHYVRFQTGQTPSDGLACHETGHAVGFRHGVEASPRANNTHSLLGCMKTPVGAGDQLTNHLKGQIKGAYG
jgi:hypothetical protein